MIGHEQKQIVRSKERYLLIGAVLTISFLAVTVSAMIHFTTAAVIDDYSDRFGASGYFTPDLRKLLALTEPDEDGMYRNPEITTEQYIAFSKSDAVRNTLFQGSRQTYGDGLIGLDPASYTPLTLPTNLRVCRVWLASCVVSVMVRCM